MTRPTETSRYFHCRTSLIIIKFYCSGECTERNKFLWESPFGRDWDVKDEEMFRNITLFKDTTVYQKKEKNELCTPKSYKCSNCPWSSPNCIACIGGNPLLLCPICQLARHLGNLVEIFGYSLTLGVYGTTFHRGFGYVCPGNRQTTMTWMFKLT